ncbi:MULTISPECIES: MHFG family PEP-CTERM protein [unclassified Roseateles]|uniref:MHFG family PEP-CTERM protein n=1 Tax=unclassified Roseateles TaxID=2626991 RepID=UPI0006F78C34|nr:MULTISPECIES: MHFG family PEP-CTERM protein [unclassified Roseateles]
MSLIATLALAASAGATLPQCNWDRPGVNPFTGDVVAAVDRYKDIPAATRDKLKARMKARSYDDIALIERDSIKGTASYAPEIRDMHFGPGAVCNTVTRSKWTAATQERGLVYCEDGQCILVPTVCRNVSRIRRLDKPAAIAPAQAANVASSTREGEDNTPLEFEAPAAGPMAAAPETFATASGVPALGGAPAQGGSFSLAGGNAPAAATAGGGGVGLVNLGMPALPPGRVSTADTDLPGDNIPAVPEPGTWAMIAAGLLVIAFRARQKR